VWQSDPITALCHRDIGGIAHVGLLSRTSLVVLVGGGLDPFDSPNKAVLWDDTQCRVVCYVELRLPIVGIQRRPDLLVLATKSKVRAYVAPHCHLYNSNVIVNTALSPTPTHIDSANVSHAADK
jgi:hypothetical protein